MRRSLLTFAAVVATEVGMLAGAVIWAIRRDASVEAQAIADAQARFDQRGFEVGDE